jgi:hypothetical protein
MVAREPFIRRIRPVFSRSAPVRDRFFFHTRELPLSSLMLHFRKHSRRKKY